MAQIVIQKDGTEVSRQTLTKRLVSLGRAPKCEVLLGDPDVSSLHANLLTTEEGCRLIDPGSTNGIFVGGKRVREHLLKDGDVFQIGRFRITFQEDDDLEKTAVTVLEQDFLAQSQTLLNEIKRSRLEPILEKAQDSEAGLALRHSIDELDQTLSSAQRAQAQLKTLLHMAEVINSAKGFDSTLSAILDTVLEATNMERGVIVLYDDEKKLHPVVSVGLSGDETQEHGGLISTSVVNKALDSGEPVIMSDIQDEAGELKSARSIVAQNILATICLPLKSRTGKMLGVLYMDSRLSVMSATHVSHDFLRMFGIFAATAIQTRQMAQREKEISEELAAAREREKLQARLQSLEQENKLLVKRAGETRLGNLIGMSPVMQKMYGLIEKVAPTDVTVMITGETGTGKGVAAKAIHDYSERRNRDFITIDCASIPSELLESELFGHEKGAFTGAIQQKKGRIELAEGGTLFLDEIGDLSLPLQSKMLRFLQEKSFERVGGNKTMVINVRVLAATNKDLKKEVEEKRFREDLYYRLCGVSIQIPPLRDREEDVLVLAGSFLAEIREQNNLAIKGFSPEAKNAILQAPWQGNVRQLKNVVQRAAILTSGEYIGVEDLGLETTEATTGVTLKEARETTDKQLIRKHLMYNKGNQSKTARDLDIDRGTLRELMKKYGIEETDA